MTMISYAQNFEDVMLWRALANVSKGHYIDIGAQDPVIDSVSKAFYDKGWRGIHVEATSTYAEKLRQDRPDEIVIQAAVNDMSGSIVLHEIPGGGLSTGDVKTARSHIERGFNVQAITVPCITLEQVLARALSKDIHWLKIDVEGMEYQVLKSWRSSKALPWIVVVESTLPLTTIESHAIWEHCLLEKGYRHVYFDGLNRYYVSPEHQALAAAFKSGPNVFDNFSLAGNSSAPFCSEINEKHRAAQKVLHLQIVELQRKQVLLNEAAHRSLAEVQHELSNSKIAIQTMESRLHDQDAVFLELENRLRLETQTAVALLNQTKESATKSEYLLQEQINHIQSEAEKKEQNFKELLAIASHQAEASSAQLASLQSNVDAALAASAIAQRNYDGAQKRIAELVGNEQTLLQKILDERTQFAAAVRLMTESHELQLSQLQTRLEEEVKNERQNAILQTHLLNTAQKSLDDIRSTFTWRISEPLRRLSSRGPPPKLGGVSPAITTQTPSQVTLSTQEFAAAPPRQQNSTVREMTPHKSTKQTGSPTKAQTLDHLMAWNGREFVDAAYYTLLNRSPDPEGLQYYMHRLRSGFTKIGVLKQLRHSAEGKVNAAELPGLDTAIKRYTRGQSLLFGWIFKWLERGESDSLIERKLRIIENRLIDFQQESNEKLRGLENQLVEVSNEYNRRSAIVDNSISKVLESIQSLDTVAANNTRPKQITVIKPEAPAPHTLSILETPIIFEAASPAEVIAQLKALVMQSKEALKLSLH